MPVAALSRRAAASAAALLAGAALAAGCGEKDYDAEGLVAELNAAGAGLVLGQPLSSTEGSSVTAIDLAEGGGGTGGAEHTEGAIVVLDDSEAASQEFARCEGAVDFVCFRAANAVLRFSGITPEEQARITGAVSSLETD